MLERRQHSSDQNVAELVEALRRAQLDTVDPPLEAVAGLLAERAPILDAILSLDPRDLSAEARAHLAAALEEARSHDAELTRALAAVQAKTGAALSRLVEARSAARGYRGGPVIDTGTMLRTA